MRKLLLILLVLAPAAIPAQTQFWSDTFEDVGAPSSGTRTPSVTFNASTERYFDRVTTAQVNTTLTYASFEGLKFWGVADIDNISGQNTQSPHQNVTWSSINISGRTGLSFKGLFATGTNNNFDHFPGSSPIDYMIVEYRIDGGAWTNLVRFFPNLANNGSGALALETTGDSLAQGEGAALSGTFTEFSANIAGTGTLLDIRVKFQANGTSFEEMAADNFRLFETPACSNPVINTPPANTNVCVGANTTFTIASTGATTYQWQVNTGSGFNNLSNVAPHSGVTTQTLTITSATAGMNGYIYRCIATNGTCNTTTTSATLTVSNPATSVASLSNVSCFGGANGSASVAPASGGLSPYTYNWTPGNPTGDGTVSVTGLTFGTWTCTVTDNIGCTTTQTFNVTQPTALSLTSAAQTNVSCFGGSNGAASVNVATGGAGSYTYNWTPGNPTGDGTVSVTGLTFGTWTCTVTDANSCTTTRTFNITQPTAALAASVASQTNVSCFGGSNGAASVSVTGGTTSYSYNWTPGNPTGDGTASVTGLTFGTWTCTVTDANSCVTTQTFNITQPTALAVTASSQTNVSCFGGSTGAAAVNTPTGGAGSYTYNWTPGNPAGDGTVSVTGLTFGTWTCTVTDANSCTTTQTFNITQPTAIVVTPSTQTNVSCNGGSNGAAAINTPTGGAGSYTYNWTPGNPTGDGTVSVTGLAFGTWTCTVTDANSCTTTQTFNITQPTALSLTSAAQTNVSCFGGSNGAASVNVATGGAGSYTYNWTPGNPTGDGTVSVTGLTFGTWTCTVTDANSCTTTRTFNITQPTAALAASAASQTNVSCFGGSNGAASVSVTGGTTSYSYNWTPGNPTGDGTASVSGLTFGTWTCTVTDANSCVTTQTFNITQPTAMAVSPASQTNISCFGGSNGAASINTPTGGAGSYTYNWTPGNPTGDGTTSVSGLTFGSWTCTVTDANSCTTTQTFNITQPTALAVTPVSQTNVFCNGGSNGAASVSVSGGTLSYTYDWTPGSPTGDGTASVTNLTIGTWQCNVTDANGCTSSQTFNITEPSVFVANASAGSIACNGGSTTVTVSGSGGTAPYSGEGTFTISAGTYSYPLTDANGCAATASVTVTEPSLLVASSSSTSIACNGGTATITVSGSGGTGPYSGEGNFTVSAGTYSYPVTDANGCADTSSITVTEPAAISIASGTVNVSCFGGSDASIDLTVTGGTGAFTFDWNSGTYLTEDISGLAAGTYAGLITDANSCTDSVTIVITEPSQLLASLTATSAPSSCGATDGSIDITVSGGTAGYAYLWNTSAVTEDISGIGAGAYSCTVTDTNGCTTVVSASLNDPNAPVVTLALSLDTACQTTTAPFTLTGESPAGGIFSGPGVSGNTFDPMLANLGMNIITYTFTDSSGCTGSITDSIYVDICSGMNTAGHELFVQAYPNPSNGMLTVVASGYGNVISVFDALGHTVYLSTAVSAKTEIDLSALPAGIYFLKVENPNAISTHKIILNKQ